MKTIVLVPYLRGGVTKKSVAQNFSRDPGAIKSVGIESRDIELFKKSNETF